MSADFERLPPVQAFGQWDAPITDGAEWIDVPLERTCMHCQESFMPGDNGAILPNGYAEHRECGFRAVMGGIGHHIDHAKYCRSELGTDAGLTTRASALLVWRHCIAGPKVTAEELEHISAHWQDA